MIPAPFLRALTRAVALVAAWSLSAASTSAAQPAWRMLETPRFTVISQLGDKPTRVWAEEFNQFTEELRRVFKAGRPHVPPLTVVLFARDREFSRYKPLRPDGRGSAPIAGFFNHHGNWSVIGLADSYTEEATRALIFHEAVHWFTSADPVSYPLWLAEGLAEVFSTFRQEKGKVRWGTGISGHVDLLRTARMLPFERFLYVTRDDPLFNQSHRTGIFYAQAWVFVHYLMFGAHDGSRDAIAHYFDLLAEGRHPDTAFQDAFGHDYTTMAQTLTTYIRTGRYEMRLRPESAKARIATTAKAAPAAIVDVALARLALAAERLDTARLHAERAVALAPQQPGGHEVLAQVHQRAGHRAAALESCARAEQAGSQDASTLFLLAYLSAAEFGADGGAAKARKIAHLYRRVIAASPTMEEAYQNLAGIAPALESVEAADIAALKQGARMFPGRGDVLLGLAALVERQGDRATARALLVEARRRGLPLEAEPGAARMENRWLYDEGTVQIDALLRQQRFTEARATCDDLISRIADIYMRAALVRTRQEITWREHLTGAEDALRTGDVATARRLFEEVAAASGVPGSLRRHVESVLQRLREANPAATSPDTDIP